ncbi:CLUMA_CG021264, isoform A [Clunio marinus]|uniref:Large ribosomal subunit protein uL4m n=1 Tax=Clunio marinus TaxID=568069 RepID=A0A1J1J7M4_9DIPT|nr:CLUMA_CG021264, isoform A [Clunio marinus]
MVENSKLISTQVDPNQIKTNEEKMIRVKLFNIFLQTRAYSASKASRKVSECPQEKIVKVSVIGMPNSGKSTFINAIMEQRVCATSDKVHTTTNYAQAITNRKNSQIVVFDTPGLVTKKEMKQYKHTSQFVSACRESIEQSNIIGVLHDVSNFWTRGQLHPIILELLHEYKHLQSFLILNKIDKIKSKRVLLELVKTLTCNNIALVPKQNVEIVKQEPIDKDVEFEKKVENGWPNFSGVFMVSALNGDGIQKVADFVEKQAVEGAWEYRNNEVTDQKPTDVIVQFVRARLLDYLHQEIPYNLKLELEYFSDENHKIFASVNIFCPSERIEKLVCEMLNLARTFLKLANTRSLAAAPSSVNVIKQPEVIKYANPLVEEREVWVENMDTLDEEKLEIMKLNPKIFAATPRIDIIHQNVHWQKLYRYVSFAHAKHRFECRGGGRKPWPQKGLGRARHGSIRSPLFRGGGVTHGPRSPTTHFYMLPFFTRVHGLTTTLSVKLAQDDLHVVKDLEIPTDDEDYIKDLIEKRNWGPSVLIVDDNDMFPENIAVATDTISYVNLMPVYGLNCYSMIKHDTLVLTQAAVEKITERILYQFTRADEKNITQKFRLSQRN